MSLKSPTLRVGVIAMIESLRDLILGALIGFVEAHLGYFPSGVGGLAASIIALWVLNKLTGKDAGWPLGRRRSESSWPASC